MIKDVKDFPGYRVTSDGLILGSRFGKPLKQFKDKNGYPRVGLSRDSITSSVRVHRVVAEAFLDNPKGLLQVHHKNNDRSDSRVQNLEWVSAKENIHRILWKFIECPNCTHRFSPASLKISG